MTAILQKPTAIPEECDRLAQRGLTPIPEANSTAAMPGFIRWPLQTRSAASPVELIPVGVSHRLVAGTTGAYGERLFVTQLEGTPVAGIAFILVAGGFVPTTRGSSMVVEEKARRVESPRDPSEQFLTTIDAHIKQDIEDAKEEGSIPPAPPAITRCKAIAYLVSQYVIPSQRLKYAAATQEDGGVSLVVQSLEANRRLEISISPDGSAITVTKVDECLRVTHELHTDNKTLVEPASWVVGNR